MSVNRLTKWKNGTLHSIAGTVSRLMGVNETLENVDGTRSEWYRFSQHSAKVLQAVLDVLPMGEDSSPRLRDAFEDLHRFLETLAPFFHDYEHADTVKVLLDAPEKAEQIRMLREELDDKVRLFQLNLEIDQRKALQENFIQAGVDIKADVAKLQSTLDASFQVLETLPYVSGASWSSSYGCMSGTRSALLDEMSNWMQAAGSANCAEVYWLFGVAGSGKTAIANSISRIAAEHGWLISSFFFNRMSDERNKPEKLISTIARDYAGRDPRAAVTIASKLSVDVSLRSTTDVSRQFQELIIDPAQSSERTDPAVIVVDALDEGYDERLLQLFAESLTSLPSVFRVIITSRPILDITLLVEDRNHHQKHWLSTTSEDGVQDIRAYVTNRLHNISKKRHLPSPWPTPLLFDALIHRAEGLFQWAFTVTEYLSKCLNPNRQLQRIVDFQGPPSISDKMDQLYATVLEGIRAEDDEDFVQAYRTFMGAILAAKEPLTLSAMRMLHPDSEVDPLDLLERLSSVVVGLKHEHHPVRILHLSMREYLSQRAAEPYYLSVVDSSTRLAILCLEAMRDHLEHEAATLSQLAALVNARVRIPKVGPSEISDGLYYATNFWTRHLRDTTAGSHRLIFLIKTFIDKGLDTWLLITICLGRYYGTRELREWLRGRGPEGTQALQTISTKEWATRFRFFSELLRRDARLEEACVAAEDAIASIFGVSWRLEAAEAEGSETRNDSAAVALSAIERAALAARTAVERLPEVLKMASDELLYTTTVTLDQMTLCLTAVGQGEEAYALSENVVRLRRTLSVRDFSKYGADLAWSLGNFSEALSRRGERILALTAIDEAIRIFRSLHEEKPDQFQENIAWSLGTLSKRLSEPPYSEGEMLRALQVAQEAVERYRPLASENPMSAGQNLAWALGQWSSRLAHFGRYQESLTAQEESVNLCRSLVGRRPDIAILPDLALQLHNMAARQNAAGHPEQAFSTVDEALVIYRDQYRKLPLRYNAVFVQCLLSKCGYACTLGRYPDGLVTLKEVEPLLSALAIHQPSVCERYKQLYVAQREAILVSVERLPPEAETKTDLLVA